MHTNGVRAGFFGMDAAVIFVTGSLDISGWGYKASSCGIIRE